MGIKGMYGFIKFSQGGGEGARCSASRVDPTKFHNFNTHNLENRGGRTLFPHPDPRMKRFFRMCSGQIESIRIMGTYS